MAAANHEENQQRGNDQHDQTLCLASGDFSGDSRRFVAHVAERDKQNQSDACAQQSVLQAGTNDLGNRNILRVCGGDGGVGDRSDVIAEVRGGYDSTQQQRLIASQRDTNGIQNRSQRHYRTQRGAGSGGKHTAADEYDGREQGTADAEGSTQPGQTFYQPRCFHNLGNHAGENQNDDNHDNGFVGDTFNQTFRAIRGFFSQCQCGENTAQCRYPESHG